MATEAELDNMERAANEAPNTAETPPIECKADELSTNFYYTFGKHETFNAQMTVRGNPTFDELNAHLAAAIDAMKLVIDAGGHAKPVGYQAANHAAPPPATTPAQAAQEVGKGNVSPIRDAYSDAAGQTGIQAPTPKSAAPAAPQAGTSDAHCILIEIGMSYSGGKTQLKFVCVGMEHPLTFTKAVSEMVKLLAPLGYTAAHIVVGQRYQANCIVKYGETEKDGKTYKNVLSVHPAA